MSFGSGKYTYDVIQDWAKLPAGWEFGVIPAVACDSHDRVFVGSRGAHPLLVFDREGNLLESWGGNLLQGAHGLYVDAEDNVFCTVHDSHCIYKFDPDGELVLILGTPGMAADQEGEPFNKPTDIAVASNGALFVSDGYGNARIHRFSSDGKHLLSWGEPGSGPGQFQTPHCVRLDSHERVWVCDRNNRRIQIFDIDGNLLKQIEASRRPDCLYIDTKEGVAYVTEIEQRLSVFTIEGELITQGGGDVKSDVPGHFLGGPHGVWADSHGDLYVTEALVDGRLQKFIRQ